MKKLFALMLAVLMIFALVGCKDNKRQIVQLTLSTEDSEAILAAAGITLPTVEEARGANSTVVWYSHEDPFHNYSEAEIINTGYWTFVNKYNCEVKWYEIVWGQQWDGLSALILAGHAPDFYGSFCDMFPYYISKGIFSPVDDYVNYDDPLWSDMKDFVDKYYTIGDHKYMIVYDATFDTVCAYNRRVLDEWGYDDPAELYYNDEWTWDVFYDMCVDFTDADETRHALGGFSPDRSLIYSSGAMIAKYNTETKLYESSMEDPRLDRAASLLYDLNKNDCFYPGAIIDGIEGKGMKEGKMLFFVRAPYCFTGPVVEVENVWGSLDELMFAPIPRDDDGDGHYYIETLPKGYFLVKGGENHAGVGLLAACERFKTIDPTVEDIDRKQLRETYHWTQDMLDMWDVCYALANSDTVIINYDAGFGTGGQLGSTLSSILGNFRTTSDNMSTWAQLKEEYGEALVYYTDKLNKQIADYEASQQ